MKVMKQSKRQRFWHAAARLGLMLVVAVILTGGLLPPTKGLAAATASAAHTATAIAPQAGTISLPVGLSPLAGGFDIANVPALAGVPEKWSNTSGDRTTETTDSPAGTVRLPLLGCPGCPLVKHNSSDESHY